MVSDEKICSHTNSVSIGVVRAILFVGQSKSIFVQIFLKVSETCRKTFFGSKFHEKMCPFANIWIQYLSKKNFISNDWGN